GQLLQGLQQDRLIAARSFDSRSFEGPLMRAFFLMRGSEPSLRGALATKQSISGGRWIASLRSQ
ncbi:MAG: hypothetical protein ACRECG_05600, partial [Bradyrhizobium sp.]